MTTDLFNEIINDKAKRKFACEHSLLFFSLYYFSKYHTYSVPDFHKDWYKDMTNDKVIGLMLITFRESAKSSIAKIRLIHDICYNKNHFTTWTSYDKKKAEANLFDVALELQTNERILADFGQLFYEESVGDKKSTKKSIGEFITTNGIKVKAYSTGQSPRGEVYGEFRPDRIYLDDIENMDTVDSDAMTDEVKRYIDELLSGMASYAKVIVLANRLTFNGSIAYLENRVKDIEGWKIYDLPVVRDGNIMWPSKYVKTDKEAEEVNKTIENNRNKKVSLETKERLLGYQTYNREMLNTPLTENEVEFKKAWYQYRTRQELSSFKCRKFLVIDTAMGEKEVHDYTGITEIFIDNQGFWTISAQQYKMNPADFVNHMFNMYQSNGYEAIGIEKTTFTEGLKPFIQQQQRERGIFLPIRELTHGGTKKETRIRGLIPMYSSKSIFHIVGECADLERQQQTFPKSEHDDILDSLAYGLQLVPNNIAHQNQVVNQQQTQFRPKGFTNHLE